MFYPPASSIVNVFFTRETSVRSLLVFRGQTYWCLIVSRIFCDCACTIAVHLQYVACVSFPRFSWRRKPDKAIFCPGLKVPCIVSYVAGCFSTFRRCSHSETRTILSPTLGYNYRTWVILIAVVRSNDAKLSRFRDALRKGPLLTDSAVTKILEAERGKGSQMRMNLGKTFRRFVCP
jgi:hypothetical protein